MLIQNGFFMVRRKGAQNRALRSDKKHQGGYEASHKDVYRRGDSRIARKNIRNDNGRHVNRPYKQISAEILYYLPIYVIMELTKSLALWERWRRSRRRGLNCAQRTLSPASERLRRNNYFFLQIAIRTLRLTNM